MSVQYTPLSVPGLGLSEPGLISSTLLQGNTVHGRVGLCAGLSGPHSDFLELQTTGRVLWELGEEGGAQSCIRQQALMPTCSSGM